MERKKGNLYAQMEKKALEEQGLNSENTVFPSFLDSTPSFLNFCQLPEVHPTEQPQKIEQSPKPKNVKNHNPSKKGNDVPQTISFLDDNLDFLAHLTNSTQNSEPQAKEKQKKENSSKSVPTGSGLLKIQPQSITHFKTGKGEEEDDSDYIRSPLPKQSSLPIQAIPTRTTIPKTLVVLVYCILDTNVYIHNLENVKHIINDSSIRLVVPLVVTRELDGLKRHHLHATNAQHANQLLLNYKNKVIGQLPHETVSQEIPNTPDEAIIWCASYFQKKVCENTVLVSNDKNLQVHAIYHFGLSSMCIKKFITEHVKKQKYEIGSIQ